MSPQMRASWPTPLHCLRIAALCCLQAVHHTVLSAEEGCHPVGIQGVGNNSWSMLRRLCGTQHGNCNMDDRGGAANSCSLKGMSCSSRLKHSHSPSTAVTAIAPTFTSHLQEGYPIRDHGWPAQDARPLHEQARAHHVTDVGKPPMMDTIARCIKYSVAEKSRHFFALSTCAILICQQILAPWSRQARCPYGVAENDNNPYFKSTGEMAGAPRT